MQTPIIALANQKGGVGKTTSAANLGTAIAQTGKRVLLVDFDAQANLTSSFGIHEHQRSAYELLVGALKLSDATVGTPILGLDLVPASLSLSGLAAEVGEMSDQHYLLKNAIEPAASTYDIILIDSPPSLGILTLNALAASTGVLVPLQCEFFAMEGLTQLAKTIRLTKKKINQSLTLTGIFFTMFDKRTNLSQQVVKEVTGYFGDTVLRTIIPRSVRLAEAPSHGLPIQLYDPDGTGAKSYNALAEEVLRRV